ncbi:MAG: redoxin family protein [Chromatiales bacterium]|jgi:peroxiredoxin|nr:redoxin family protein [Chromatiales bacterium]MDX9766327.1 redoxin family protein [Ectothiorhodospiraceae bacterium]
MSDETTESKKPSRRRWLRWGVELLVIATLILGLRAWQMRDLVAGDAPALDAVLLDGTPVSLADYRGRPVLVYFWATWCGVCKANSGFVQGVSGDWPVLTVAMQSGGADEIRRHLGEHGLDFPVIPDELGQLSGRFGVRVVPTNFIIDGDGRIRYREVGFTTGWGLRLRLWLAGW